MSSPHQAEEGSFDDEDDPLMEGDPFVHIIDRVDAIKNSFSTFYQTWKDEGFPDEVTKEDIKDQLADKTNGQLEKIEKMTDKFANILGRLSDLVKQMELDEDACYDMIDEIDENEEEEEEEEEEDDDAPCETVLEFEDLITNYLVPFLDAVNSIGGEVQQQGRYVAQAFGAQREMLEFKQLLHGTNEALGIRELLVDTSEFLMEIEEKCDMESDNRHHLTLVSSGMPCLAWVSVPMNPSGYISDMINSIPVYGDKIVKSTSMGENAEDHVEFVKTFRDMLRGLNDYVKTYHNKGLSWNMDGEDFATVRDIIDNVNASNLSGYSNTSP
ncbi:hypothetical protein GUITHDRAFT_165520 [Guillardia theta CCMP2712]|uniref:CAP N-terminal domain-containing protein n=1 Tax=Guillardia theta (strain CCMP2712) TaxID=905079 RepID=L1IM17_GUITC|nr:hypothetical protein GUITHDRAFT_165520 [Guillardia theta CCMP2712]EKX37308.1 hypothetical protein GUITHDRAFT_165520 [Guillardia theta CCMP2712]|eukprot:XP_005824288.1 hypothetical protein GUITHDRAFT_165520 [Guillardia theta CCMP2712]